MCKNDDQEKFQFFSGKEEFEGAPIFVGVIITDKKLNNR